MTAWLDRGRGIVKNCARHGLHEDCIRRSGESVRAMTALAAADRTSLRRWTISAAIVVLVHGAIATVVTWRRVMAPAEPPSPIVIEVVPMPVAPVPPQTELAPLVPNTAPGTPIENLERKTGETAAPTGHETAGPPAVEQKPSETAPVTLAPPQSPEGKHGMGTQETTGGVAPGAARANRSADNPIETRIGEPSRRPKQTTKPNNRKIILTRPYSGARQPPDRGPGDIVRNTIGLPVPNGIARTNSKGTKESKNTVGAPLTNTPGDASTSTVSRTIRNSIGVTVQVPPAASGASIGAAPRGTTPRAGIDGGVMGRRNTSSIGGAARNPAGVINGTAVRR
jgi:hypothetical protein